MPQSLSTCCGWCFAHSRAPILLRSGTVFCGCGTTIDAEKLGRDWIGIDPAIAGQLAISLIILFRDDPKAARPEQIIIQVKGGKTGVKDVRDLRGMLDREKAAIGILISLQPPTGPMETEAASAGFFEHKINGLKYPKLQLRTVKELMEGKGIERPSTIADTDETFKKAPESKKKHDQQTELGV